MTIEQLYNIYQQHPVICTDTRKITTNCLFFALKGDKFDANDFASDAIKAGASYAIVDNQKLENESNMILVKDVLTTLQDLARYHRERLNIPVIGITGSNGKTTSKELINSVLSQKYKTFATQGNLNNHIGVPLSILSIDKSVEVAIIEMGANHQKEIELLCSISKPTYGLITNVGRAHLEGFGGFDGVKKGKKELYDYIKTNSGTVFLNADNEHLAEMAVGLDDIVTYGTGDNAQLKGRYESNGEFVSVLWVTPKVTSWYKADSNLVGSYNFENLMVSVAIGYTFNLSNDEIKKGIESYVPSNSRSQMLRTQTNTLICDYYNANTTSMLAAINNFSNLDSGSKFVILGDMFELGEYSYQEHCRVVEKLIENGFKNAILIGHNFFTCRSIAPEYLFFQTTLSAIEYIKDNPITNHSILVKGSRGMRLETIAELL